MDEDGNLLAPGELGEVVIRGRNVTAGYENNPDANAKAFTNGWFRTGDQGIIDAGRLSPPHRPFEGTDQSRWRKDQPDRSGRRADGPSGGGAAPDFGDAPSRCWARKSLPPSCCGRVSRAAEHELRDFVAGRPPQFKVPRKIIFLEEIPEGATGKLQRIGLAEKLGLTG